MLAKFRSLQWTHIVALVGCGVVALIFPLLVSWFWPSLLEPIELWAVDLQFQLRPSIPVAAAPRQEKSDTLLLIDYDDRAARDYGLGRWPWDRRVHARVLDLLREAGARLVLVDLLFEHPSRDPAEDQAMVEASRRSQVVFYPVVFTSVAEADSSQTFSEAAPQHLVHASVHGFGAIPAVGELTLPLPGLVETAAGLGHIQRTTDRGGVLRRIPLVYATKGGFVPSLALAAALRDLDVDPGSIHVDRGREIRFTPGDGEEVIIPIDAQGRVWINYAGKWAARFVHYPYSWMLDLLRTEQGKARLLEIFHDKIVVVSNLTTGSGDRVATPFERDFPTSEAHAHLLNMIMTQQFLRDATLAEASLALFLPILILTASALIGGPAIIVPTFAVLVSAYLLLLQNAFVKAGLILPAVNPLLALTVGLVLLLVTRFFIVDRERVKFQSVLGACLPPQTIRIIQQSPGMISTLLAGHTRELTVLFADIKEFSKFCQHAAPLHIQSVLRDYLTVMTIILRDHGGTLDKYMGDGIMAFFGDAEPQEGDPDEEELRVGRHAANAVRAALAMQHRMGYLNQLWESQGKEPHEIRIGVNTGVVTVGNLGTEYLWDYTVIGPEVNKAQRLEKAAEPGGILLSGRTYALAYKHGVFLSKISPKSISLKGIGRESGLHAVSPEAVAELAMESADVPLPLESATPTRPAHTRVH